MTRADSEDPLVLDLVIRALDRQATVLGELRTRTGVVLAATAIVVSLFGPTALKQGLDGSDRAAFAAFALGMAACMYILVPVKFYGLDWVPRRWRNTWRTDVDLKDLTTKPATYPSPAGVEGAALAWRVAVDLEAAHDGNA